MADFTKFKLQYGYIVSKTHRWMDAQAAFEEYKTIGEEEFLMKLNYELEFADFCTEFYDTLREMWNIDSSGMYEAFEKLKEKGWSFEDYRIELNAIRKAKQAARRKN